MTTGKTLFGGLVALTLLSGCATAAATPGKWIDLKVGDCVTDLPPADLSRVTINVVDCGTPHLAEVYLRTPMAVDTVVAAVANRDCAGGVASYTGHPVDASPYSITYLIDSNQDRTGADPTPSTSSACCNRQTVHRSPDQCVTD